MDLQLFHDYSDKETHQQQCKSLGLQKSSYYCKPKGESSLNQLLMKAIDKKYLECPFYGTRRMTTYLNMDLDYRVDRKKIKRY